MERTSAWIHCEQQALMLSVREWNPTPGWRIPHINFLTEYHLSLDLNQPAEERIAHRKAALALAHEIRYGKFASPAGPAR